MVRDGAHRSQVYAGCACDGAPPHHEPSVLERDARPEPPKHCVNLWLGKKAFRGVKALSARGIGLPKNERQFELRDGLSHRPLPSGRLKPSQTQLRSEFPI
jgi:hypothetical protein